MELIDPLPAACMEKNNVTFSASLAIREQLPRAAGGALFYLIKKHFPLFFIIILEFLPPCWLAAAADAHLSLMRKIQLTFGYIYRGCCCSPRTGHL
jgi:hypothetical protein